MCVYLGKKSGKFRSILQKLEYFLTILKVGNLDAY